MELNDFIKKFSDQFDALENSALKGETKFRDIKEWSSLISLSVIAMVDEEYGIIIKGDDIRNSQTIQDLYDIIKSKM